MIKGKKGKSRAISHRFLSYTSIECSRRLDHLKRRSNATLIQTDIFFYHFKIYRFAHLLVNVQYVRCDSDFVIIIFIFFIALNKETKKRKMNEENNSERKYSGK